MSALHLYDTATREVGVFKPLIPGQVSIYVCGATVQSHPHIGHVRSAVNFDILRRWLTWSGYDVTFIRNVTDIDDKILHKAVHEKSPWWAVAMKYERIFTQAFASLNVLPPTYEPRATGHITQMIELMQILIDNGAAYAPGNGDVYLEVRKLKRYLTLSGQKLDDLMPAADADETFKRDPRDFALWKAAKAGDPSWPTPWGAGRPGWHLECSAMAHAYLGEAFDIHGGGLDLVFPHHENEIAQSEAAGYKFANRWLHNAWVTQSGEKMSKSLGNTLQVEVILQRVRGIELRWYLGSAHYRSMLEYSEAALDESAVAFRRIENFLLRATEILGSPLEPTISDAFCAAMNDDLAVPAGLASISENLRAGNQAITDGDKAAIAKNANEIRGALQILGCDPYDSNYPQSSTTDVNQALDGVIKLALKERAAARERKDFAASDAIRDGLLDLGIELTMAGNSSRKGAIRQSKKGPSTGTGGKNKKRLSGKGPTPKAEDRPYHAAAKRKKAAEKKTTRTSAPRSTSPRATTMARTTPSRAPRGDRPRGEIVAGRNAVLEALREAVPATELLVARSIDVDDRVAESLKLALHLGLPIREAHRAEVEGISPNSQGIILAIKPYQYSSFEEIMQRAKHPALIVALDGVTDPRNLGAIVRSAAAFGAAGVLMTERRAAAMTASAWKASAGAAARMPIAQVTNLARTIDAAKKEGLFVVGLDGESDDTISAMKVAAEPIMVVVGSEGKGLARLTREKCDLVISIPISASTESLNASVATSIALFHIDQARRKG